MVMEDESPSKITLALDANQEELIQLSELAGIRMDPEIFRIAMELLNLGVKPTAIYNVLKKTRKCLKKGRRVSIQSRRSDKMR